MVEVPPPKYVKIQEKPPPKPPKAVETATYATANSDRPYAATATYATIRDIDEDHTTGMKLQKNHKKRSENIKNSDQDHKMVDVQTYHEMHSIEKQKSEHFGGYMVSDLLGKHPHLMEGVVQCQDIREYEEQHYRVFWTGLRGQLARDVPFSTICWSTLELVRRRLLSVVGEEANTATMLGANFLAGFVAEGVRALRMTTRQILMEVWRYCSLLKANIEFNRK
ncbi:hypothetical protein L2E82_36081 [Cichorium intybus]|uniref:Uncharacterized protein n=1 Tax=Cichorium intybus TaxID=13427 RepID=A0ACB9BQK1_CICIN|nr:hypothetical protein L2E82_36081 [Cichorium intybus]